MKVLLLLCILGGVAIYFLIVRPFLVPLTQRIPSEAKYLPSGLRSGR